MAEWDYAAFWDETMKTLRSKLGEQVFSVWIAGLEYLNAGENSINIGVPSAFYRDQVINRHQNDIVEELTRLSGKELTLNFVVLTGKAAKPKPEQAEASAPNKEPAEKTPGAGPHAQPDPAVKPKKGKHPQMRDDYTFEKYVVAENNSFAANAARAISKNPGTAYNPFLIYGGVGLGKTHLMQAIGNYIYENSEDEVICVTSEEFLNEYMDGIAQGKMNAFKNKFRYTDILLIDDIQFFQDKPGVQEELFHTFNALHDAKKQLVFTCDRPVSELKKFSERLISRFELCLKVDLQPPRYETRCAILKATAESQGVNIPDAVIDLIGKNVSSNVRDLISSLNTLIAYTKLMGQPITLEIAQQRLRDVFVSPRQANMSIENIQRVVAEYFSLSPNDLKGKKKPKSIAFPRQLAMYVAREMTDFSTTELGQAFGGRDHATVIYSIDKIRNQLITDPTLDSTIESIKRQIKEFSAK